MSLSSRSSNTHFILFLFFFFLLIPTDASVNIGGINLPPYRFFLLVILLPCFFSYLTNLESRKNWIDLLVFCYVIWGVISLFKNHGTSSWQYAGVLALETIVPYMIAKNYVRSLKDVRQFVKIWIFSIIFMLPFIIFETLTGNHIIRDLFRLALGYSSMVGRPERLGLDRAFGPFDHPILFGVFCASSLGLVYYTFGRGRINLSSILYVISIGVATFCSLSSGPLAAFSSQMGLIFWEMATKRIPYRWSILTGIAILMYAIVDLISNRTPFHVFITYLTFRLQSSYNRIHIWNYGTASVSNYPFFGIGLGEWERPPWMSSSMDNFWLLTAVRYGIPAFIFLAASIFLAIKNVKKIKVKDRSIMSFRRGWMITIFGLIFAGCTVHFWNQLYCLVFFLLGSSCFLIEDKSYQKPRNRKKADI